MKGTSTVFPLLGEALGGGLETKEAVSSLQITWKGQAASEDNPDSDTEDRHVLADTDDLTFRF